MSLLADSSYFSNEFRLMTFTQITHYVIMFKVHFETYMLVTCFDTCMLTVSLQENYSLGEPEQQ